MPGWKRRSDTKGGSTVTDVRCLEEGPDCSGDVAYRMSLSGTGRPIPRCDEHWQKRLVKQTEINRRYPRHAPSDWSPLDAGERWEED
jgi:hypothetical protein